MEHHNHGKWNFLKVVGGLEELDRVRRQHQMRLETEDDECIIFKCRGSAHCPYSMAFYHRQGAVYIRHDHNHDAIVPIVGRRSDGKGTTTMGGDWSRMNDNSSNIADSSVDNGLQQTTPRIRFSEFCSSSDEFEADAEKTEANGGMEDSGGREREDTEMEEEQSALGEEDTDDDDDGMDEGQVTPGIRQQQKWPKVVRQKPKWGAIRGKKSQKGRPSFWLPLGKISGAIGEVCREVCQLHFVRKGGSSKTGKYFFRCPNRMCKYRTMVDKKKRLLYCQSSHNHRLPTDEGPSAPPLPSSTAATFSPHSVSLCSPIRQRVAHLSPPLASATASSAAFPRPSSPPVAAVPLGSVCLDAGGQQWHLLASGIYGLRAIAQLCQANSLKPAMFRQKTTYLRCDRFGNACPFRGIWRRLDGRVYYRQPHENAVPCDDSTRCQQQQRHAMTPKSVGKMQLSLSNSCTTDETETPPPASFVDKLGKRWTFLAKLDVFGAGGPSPPNRTTRSTAAATTAPPSTVPITLEQQVEQLCAERHLSRSRLSSSATRIWLHCAQQRQPDISCPYRVVVHMPEGTVFHRLQHNHPVPYNLSPEREEEGQKKRFANANSNRGAIAAKTLSPPPSPIGRRRPETRSSAKKMATENAQTANGTGRRHTHRQAFVKARAAMAETGAQRQRNGTAGGDHRRRAEEGEEEEDEGNDNDETMVSLSSTGEDSDQSDYDSDHSPAYRLRSGKQSLGSNLCATWPKSEVRIKRNAFVKARASICTGVPEKEADEEETELKPLHLGQSPSIYKFASKNWHFLTANVWNKKALTDFCKKNMLRVAGGVITNTYRNRMLCVRSGCPFRALWLNRQGLVYGLRKHNHSVTPKICSVDKEEPCEYFKLADFVDDFKALAKRSSLLFRIENDVFVLMLPTEVRDQWISRLLMLRDDQSSIRLAEFTGCQEAFTEKAEQWLKTDFDGRQQFIDALNAKCAEYFQQQKTAQKKKFSD